MKIFLVFLGGLLVGLLCNKCEQEPEVKQSERSTGNVGAGGDF